MDKNEFILKRDKATSDLWAACSETMSKLDHNLVTHGIDDMILNLRKYMNREKDKALGCLCKYEALSGSIGLSDDDIRKIESLKDSMGTFIRSTGKAVNVTGKSINKAGKGTEMAGDMTNAAGDVVNTTAEASAAIPVADLVTVPTGLAAGTTVKGVGALGKGIGKFEEISGQTIESGGKLAENAGNSLRSAGSTVTKGTTDVASKVCRAMTKSGNIIVRTNGKVLSSMIKATGKTSNAASFSLSKMYEGVSMGVKCNEEKEFIR